MNAVGIDVSKGKSMIAAQSGGDHFFPSTAIYNRAATEFFCVTQNGNCSPEFGAGASTSIKTTGF